jgi:hypothetical protein
MMRLELYLGDAKLRSGSFLQKARRPNETVWDAISPVWYSQSARIMADYQDWKLMAADARET